MGEPVVVSPADGIGAIRIARPEKKNALTTAMYDSLIAALATFDADDTIRVVTLRGGDNFTAGNDLRDFLAHEFDFESAPPIRFLRALRAFSKPIVVAVRGAAIGIGTTMLLHCDCVLASDGATFALPFAKLGLVPEGASTLLLPRFAGIARASWYLMSGESFDAGTAAEMGLVAKVVPDDELDKATDAVAAQLAHLPPGALRETKRLLHHPLDAAVDDAMRRETACFLELLKSAEFREAASKLLSR
jgi:enoyl-CoA hydratase/carnithine racemase